MADHIADLSWFKTWLDTPQAAQLKTRPIAYFCAEYALENTVPTYAGGLGVLAGDVIREAGDRHMPMVAIGLYYHQGYLCATKKVKGKLVEICVDTTPESVGLEPVMLGDTRLIIKVPIQDHDVDVQVWKWNKSGVDVYLLDSNVSTNSQADRVITQRLYVSDSERRFKQEIIMGIGGLRVLEALKIHPSLYHLNEGHSALLGIELIRHEMQERGVNFEEAKAFAKRRLVLTNHTLVSAGNQVYTDDLVSLLLNRYAEQISVPVSDLVQLGLVKDSSSFSMTMLALRMASMVNAVSKLHAEKAKLVWHDHPMTAVTNGIHVPTWDRVKIEEPNTVDLWNKHQALKGDLLKMIKDKTDRDWSPDTLLLGWARRLVGYKRPLAILDDAKRLAEFARRSDKPVRLIMSGRPYFSDAEGNLIRDKIIELVDGELKDIAAYLPDYDLSQAELLVSGCDVWVNTPVVGFEACGTSGMKAALNGVLPCTTKDGWIDEVDLTDIGWILDDTKVSIDVHDKIENEISNLYYDRNSQGVPEKWVEHMSKARSMIVNDFSATRMLKAYIETMYF